MVQGCREIVAPTAHMVNADQHMNRRIFPAPKGGVIKKERKEEDNIENSVVSAFRITRCREKPKVSITFYIC
jgi:hypothetical protein